MAYFYRGPQSPREEQQVPIYTNPLSPQRNPNRLSGSMASASSIRNGLTRRFTTNNELPPTALSPIGQQRKQAAGDYTVSPDNLSFVRYQTGCRGSCCSGFGDVEGFEQGDGGRARAGRGNKSAQKVG